MGSKNVKMRDFSWNRRKNFSYLPPKELNFAYNGKNSAYMTSEGPH